jgi:flagellar M-ring protein FliF
MAWSDYWGALSMRQRVGLSAGAALLTVAAIVAIVWLMRDPYVPLAADLSAERANELAQQLERAKLPYRIDDSGGRISVPGSQLGKARAAAAAALDTPASVGLELFKETDFSSTDFAQKINYQRALQGELTRTIQTINGVRSARVHVILPEGGLFKRSGAKATAAVSVALKPGNMLTRSQVLGIQRLVAASVPEIKIDDVVVLDESGASLTRTVSDDVGDLSSAQLDLKRQADAYLESKVLRLLQDLVPEGTTTLSVDTTLEDKQARVTTEEPLAARGGSKNTDHASGVLVKERQSQRGHAVGLVQTDGYTPESDSTDWEYEYKVGNRVEQTLSSPGSIKRVSVAVALQGAPPQLSSAAVEELVAHAVGIDRSRGDSVAVLMLPAVDRTARSTPDELQPEATAAASAEHRSLDLARAPQPEHAAVDFDSSRTLVLTALVVMIVGLLAWALMRARRSDPVEHIDEEAVVAKVRQWLSEGGGHGQG